MSDKLEILQFKCKLIPLTPLHIGSGQDIEPHQYVVRNKKYYRIDIYNIFSKLNDEEKEIFTEKIEEGIIPFRSYVAKIYKEEYGFLYSGNVGDKFYTNYKKKIGGAKNKNDENMLIIKEFIQSMDNKYIPGSTLKGALRGAYLFENGEFDYPLKRDTRKDTIPIVYGEYMSKRDMSELTSKIEGEILQLNKFSPFVDPFKYITVSDSVVIDRDLEVSEVKRVSFDKKTKGLKDGSGNYTETINGKFSGGDNEIDFNINIKYISKNIAMKIKNKLKTHRTFKLKDSIKEVLTFDNIDLLESLNSKFELVLNEEIEFYKKSNSIEILDVLYKVSNELKKCIEEGDSALIRIGKGSGFTTFTHLLKNKSDRPELHPSSRVVSKDKYPMGWCKIVFEEIN